MRQLKGTGASDGIIIGRAYIFQRPSRCQRRTLGPEEVPKEMQRLQMAVDAAKLELEQLRNRLLLENAEQADIFDAHLLMLEDHELLGKVEQLICDTLCNAEAAMEIGADEVASALAELEDEYFKGRATDVRDVAARVNCVLEGRSGHPLENLDQPVIVVSKELMPSDTVRLDRSMVQGIVMEEGGTTSHAAILAKTFAIPAVMGVANATGAIGSGDLLVVDGENGVVVIQPDEGELQAWKQRAAASKERSEKLRSLAKLPATTCDGHHVALAANIGSPKDAEMALDYGADGVGLYRTEFLFMNRDCMPSEDEQYEAYSAVARMMKGHPVIVRTLDIGGDKQIKWLCTLEEQNPFLGLRGIRLCLEKEDVLITQFKALLRARVQGDIWVMLPMVADVEEVRVTKRILEKARDELCREGVPHREFPLGIMIEVPAAAVMASSLFEEVDFASIGTNDLTQYTMAADRNNAKVAVLTEALQPAVLRMIAMVTEAGLKHGKWVGVCGDMAGDRAAAPILLGLGVNELSMAPSVLPLVKEAVRSIHLGRARELARRALLCRTAGELRKLLG